VAESLASFRAGRESISRQSAAALVVEAKIVADEELTREAKEAKELVVSVGNGLKTGMQYYEAKVLADKKVADAKLEALVKVTAAEKLAGEVAEKAAAWANEVMDEKFIRGLRFGLADEAFAEVCSAGAPFPAAGPRASDG
jgi:3-methyladenine DNA glycosylase AlkD